MGLEEKKQVPFRGTAEQERQLLDFIEEHKQVGGCLMPIMQKAQEIYGYLPEEVQKMIADAMGIPMEEVYGVSTFYSQFHLMPRRDAAHGRGDGSSGGYRLLPQAETDRLT